MTSYHPEDLGGAPMLELFRAEADMQGAVLTAGLLDLEKGTRSAECFKALMRAAHSLKGAARIVNLSAIETLAHALEDCFEAAGSGTISIDQRHVDVLLRAVDLLQFFAKAPSEEVSAGSASAKSLTELLSALKLLATGANANRPALAPQRDPHAEAANVGSLNSVASPADLAFPPRRPESEERVLRLTAENLNRLLGLAGESLVESRWLRPFADSLQRLKRHHMSLSEQLDHLRDVVEDEANRELTGRCFSTMVQELAAAQQALAERMQELDMYDRRTAHLSQRLYLEVLRTRMRPFKDGVRRFPRMVRDLARSLHKQVRFEVAGESTQVDRDILERLETPLGHLIRNAVDHGCEPPEERVAAGKPAEAVVGLEARHSAGVLLVTVWDDGSGVQTADLRKAIVRRKIVAADIAERLSESEVLEYLFLPGFSLKQTVTEISGRGYGLDIVQNMVRNVRGSIRLQNQAGQGLRVQLQLPLTLSVLRALLVEVAGEPYAIPLNQINRTLKVPSSSIHILEGRRYFPFGGQQLGVWSAHELLDSGFTCEYGEELALVLIGERHNRQAVVVDRFLGERELVVQPLPAILGEVKRVSAAALMEDGAPVLILDVDDLMRTVQHSLSLPASGLRQIRPPSNTGPKRILVVDDSPTVRHLEQSLLTERGYNAETACDGLEAWGAVRTGNYDLVITDLEMPRMDGLELARRIKQEPELNKTAVLIISYKDREEDRVRGLDAGADYYLTKGNFHDQRLLRAVAELIGEPGVGT